MCRLCRFCHKYSVDPIYAWSESQCELVTSFGTSAAAFLAGRQKLTVAARTLYFFLNDRDGHTLKVR